MSDTLSNEFLSSPDDNQIRPYTVGITRHEETPATIILYGGGDVDTPALNELEIDYYSEFKSKVNDIDSENKGITGGTFPEPKVASIVTLDDVNSYYGVFNNFSLTNIQESNEQIVKLHVNFGASWNAFFFGDKPRVYQFSGYFIDSKEYPYYQEFLVAYDKYLAGRRAIENKMQTILTYDGRVLDCYILNISTSHTAVNQLIKQFQFTVLVKDSSWVRSNIDNGMEVFNSMTNEHRMGRYIKDGTAGVNNFAGAPSQDVDGNSVG